MSYGVDCTLPWLWHRPVTAAPIQPLAMGAALKGQKKKKIHINVLSNQDSKNVLPKSASVCSWSSTKPTSTLLAKR